MDLKQQMKVVRDNEENLLCIHCSTSGLLDSDSQHTPRITGITVHDVTSGVQNYFSYYLVAEKMGISKSDIKDHYDDIELNVIKYFLDFAKANEDKLWIHWNMTSVFFGFQHIEHRYQVLSGKEAYLIPNKKKFDLSSAIRSRYNLNYKGAPKMRDLMEYNHSLREECKDGNDEVELFNKGDLIRLQKSTAIKAKWFSEALSLLRTNKLKVNENSIKNKIEYAIDSTPIKVLGVVAVLFSIYQLFMVLA
ncbi:hypothetical protein P3521_07845 [Vibrio parahaemolyticus]|uniref:hypothetical protein n=2 Tax=Vibrio parahaemolyticus TaxID=670 RepID=UPI00111D13FE|nr:hypothetical protein [Vibrio parahaemolyticus]MDF4582360.1 hypothetical protein [Vibrio parahaemolyticus]MDF4669511.1 hypothetical protein [Vibrio parahaemolyticus]MDF4677378.1 hypothetical protein [Vibrio parahaemolyticus]MDF4701542.1 hypothetical protein [Vibrio parahaemolyticus]MDL2044940.1 hypothetical protein [Vibrio parahaemolyticus]